MPAFRRLFCPAGLALLCGLCTPAGAQTAAPAAAASAPSALNAEAMERARRDAANPMRVILEAGRLRRRAETPNAAPALAPAAAPAGAAPLRREIPRSVAAEPVRSDAAPATEPAPTVPPAETLPALTLAPPPEVRPAPAEVLPAPPAPVSLPAFIPAPDLAPPTLLQMVEPVIPPQVISRTGALREVTADLTLQPDGTVSEVVLAASTPRAAQRYLTQALSQWRFAPLAAARVHRVQLVFDN
ncbi:MAG: hypothetical protein IV093_01190 [Rubrivivax sp.]|nr:hypothetical protein [Rubrivivax sp.]